MCISMQTASPWQPISVSSIERFGKGLAEGHMIQWGVMPGTSSAVMAVNLTGICAVHAIL